MSNRNYVDGRWVEASDGSYAIPNPATEETFSHAPVGSPGDIDLAIAAARRAFDTGRWSRTPLAERVAILLRVADGVERRREEFRELLVSVAGAEPPTIIP